MLCNPKEATLGNATMSFSAPWLPDRALRVSPAVNAHLGQPWAKFASTQIQEGIDDSPTRPGAPSALVLGQRCGLVDGTFLSLDCPEGAGCGDPRFPNGGGGPDTVSVCLPLPVEGEVCMIDSCAKGLFCSEQTTNSSGVIPRRCEKLRSRGQACDTQFWFNKDCEPGLECRSQVCQDPCR